MYVVDERGEVYEVLDSGTYREVEEGRPSGTTRAANDDEVAAFLVRRAEAWAFVTENKAMAVAAFRALRFDEHANINDVVLLALQRAWRCYDPTKDRLVAYVRKTVRTIVLDQLKRPMLEFSVGSAGHYDERSISEQNVPDIVCIMEWLGDEDRLFLLLRFWCDMKYHEIGEMTGYSKSGAYAKVQTALERAREVIDDEERGSDLRRLGRDR